MAALIRDSGTVAVFASAAAAAAAAAAADDDDDDDADDDEASVPAAATVTAAAGLDSPQVPGEDGGEGNGITRKNLGNNTCNMS